MSKAQVSMETFLTIGIVVLIFISITVVTQYLKRDIDETKDMVDQRKDCLVLTNTINTLDANSNNAFMKINIKHDALIREPSQMIHFDDYLCRFNPKNITNGTKNIFNLSKGCVKVEYADGIIIVNNDCEVSAPAPGACPGPVVFRTNATDGNYEPDWVWISVDANEDYTLMGFIWESSTIVPLFMYPLFNCDTTQSCWGYGTYPCVIGSTPEGYKIVLLSTTGEFKPTICEESIRRVTIFKPDGMPPVAITDTTCVEGYEEKEKYA